ncbi:MAG TPA: Holliday junction DNA helicase RuvB C-terminal domain-containing protein, partial [Candidatus Dojkabacteria bacterium]|nr:Holliday junction DNA helicase RuvB C-terminal domain-containing protein [Candidatus Dojkabacteria bacterium]
RILKLMFKHFNGGPVGLSTLAASVSEDVNTIEEVYEPFLMKCGLIKRTSRGRVLTESGLKLAIELEGLISMI